MEAPSQPNESPDDLENLTSFLLTSDPALSSLVDDILALPDANPARPRTAKEWIALQAQNMEDFSQENALQYSSEVRGNGTNSGKNGVSKERCSVCHERTSVHVFFGAVACDSCRVFFSRVVKQRAEGRLKCKTGTGKCSVRFEKKTLSTQRI